MLKRRLNALKKKMAETTKTNKEHSEDIEFFDADIGALNRRKINVEGYRRRENIKNLQRQRRIRGKHRGTDKKAVCHEIANSEQTC